MLLILLAATALRLYRLDVQSFWNDEGNSARAAERTIPLILAAAEGDIHPPGYYLLLHLWRTLGGESEFALRALSAFCGVLTVAFTYSLGRRLLGAVAGVGGAFLAAFSPLAVYYSQETRMYALLGLLSAASTYILCSMYDVHRRTTSPPARLLPLVYVLTATAGLYTHYAFPFVLATHNLLFLAWWGVRARRRSGRWGLLLRWAIVQAAVLLLFLPWLPTALGAVTGWSSAGQGYGLGPALLDVFRALTVGTTLEMAGARGGLMIAGAFLVVGLVPRRRQVRAVGVLTTWLLLPVALIFIFDLYKPAYLKFLLAVLPSCHLLLAHGVENLAVLAQRAMPAAQRASRITHHVLSAVCYVFFLATVLFPSLHNLYFDPAYTRDDYRQIAADVEAVARPGDGIVLNAPNQWEVFTYYHREGAPVYPIPRGRPPRADVVTAELEQIAADHQRLFALYWGDAEADPQRLVEGWLASNAYRAGDRWYGRVRLATYSLGPLPEEPAVELDARFGEMIRLRGYTIGQGPLASGDVVTVTLFWEADAPAPERYKVFLHLLDGDGGLVAQTDGEPLANLLPTDAWPTGEILTDRHGVPVPQDAPGGAYTLVMGLYHLITGERLKVVANGRQHDDLDLGSVTIIP
jgi:mannosyltransferase